MTGEGLRLGTRRSALALAQTGLAAEQLRGRFPGLAVEIVIVRTAADRAPHLALKEIGDKALWVSDLEEQLRAGQIDVAIHSMKDLPAELAPGLCIGAIPEREVPYDALVFAASAPPAALAQGATVDGAEADTPGIHRQAHLDGLLREGAHVGTSSDRRKGQLLLWRPDLQISPVRGNVDTRLRKLDSGEWDCLVLAAAGLRRLGLAGRISALLLPPLFLPAAGQGALALEIREEDSHTRRIVRSIHHAPTAAVTAERTFVRAVGGGCSVPLGVYASLSPSQMELQVRAVSPGAIGSQPVLLEERQAAPIPGGDAGEDFEWAADLGQSLADRFLANGGVDFIRQLKQ